MSSLCRHRSITVPSLQALLVGITLLTVCIKLSQLIAPPDGMGLLIPDWSVETILGALVTLLYLLPPRLDFAMGTATVAPAQNNHCRALLCGLPLCLHGYCCVANALLGNMCLAILSGAMMCTIALYVWPRVRIKHRTSDRLAIDKISGVNLRGFSPVLFDLINEMTRGRLVYWARTYELEHLVLAGIGAVGTVFILLFVSFI